MRSHAIALVTGKEEITEINVQEGGSNDYGPGSVRLIAARYIPGIRISTWMVTSSTGVALDNQRDSMQACVPSVYHMSRFHAMHSQTIPCAQH